MLGAGERLVQRQGDMHPRADFRRRRSVKQIMLGEVGQQAFDIGERRGGRAGLLVPERCFMSRPREAYRPGATNKTGSDY